MVLKKFCLFLFAILLISLVSADLGTYGQNENVSLKANLNSTSVNISIYFPNGSSIITNQATSNVMGDIWNYTITNTSTLGRYNYDYCDQDGDNCKENFFTITATGDTFSTAGFIAGAGNIGTTNTTGFWMCTNLACTTSCQVNIQGGIIVGCI